MFLSALAIPVALFSAAVSGEQDVAAPTEAPTFEPTFEPTNTFPPSESEAPTGSPRPTGFIGVHREDWFYSNLFLSVPSWTTVEEVESTLETAIETLGLDYFYVDVFADLEGMRPSSRLSGEVGEMSCNKLVPSSIRDGQEIDQKCYFAMARFVLPPDSIDAVSTAMEEAKRDNKLQEALEGTLFTVFPLTLFTVFPLTYGVLYVTQSKTDPDASYATIKETFEEVVNHSTQEPGAVYKINTPGDDGIIYTYASNDGLFSAQQSVQFPEDCYHILEVHNPDNDAFGRLLRTRDCFGVGVVVASQNSQSIVESMEVQAVDAVAALGDDITVSFQYMHGTRKPDPPTEAPSMQPTLTRSASPSGEPTAWPSASPTASPTTNPPTATPSTAPTICADSAGTFVIDDRDLENKKAPDKDCDVWLKKSARRVYKKCKKRIDGSNNRVYNECPVTCGHVGLGPCIPTPTLPPIFPTYAPVTSPTKKPRT